MEKSRDQLENDILEILEKYGLMQDPLAQELADYIESLIDEEREFAYEDGFDNGNEHGYQEGMLAARENND